MNHIDTMLDLIQLFSDEDECERLREVIGERFPPNANKDFDQGLDNLCALFRELL